MTERILITANISCNESCEDEKDEVFMPAEGYIAASVVLFLIGFFGISLNLLVITLMWKNKQLWTPLNTILFNLVCSDFSVAMFGNPWTLASAISNKWIFGRTICKAYGFFMALLGIASITTLTVLAVERYIMVSKPFKTPSLNYKGAGFLVIGIWLYSLLLTSPPLFGWGEYVNEAANISCSVNWEKQSLNAMTYILYLFFLGLVLPLTLITFSYVNIINVMKKNTLKMGRVSKAESRVVYMIFIMIAAFLLAWSPYAIFALISQFGSSELISPGVGVIPALVAKSSICYNPIIYIGLNTQFRQLWHQMIFGGLSSKDISLAEMDGNTKDFNSSRYVTQITQESEVHSKLLKTSKIAKTTGNRISQNKYNDQELSSTVNCKAVANIN